MHLKPITLSLAAITLTMLGCTSRADAPLPEPTTAMATSAQARWPDVTLEQLTRGHAIMAERCNTCHGMPAPSSEGVGEWPVIMKRMAKKAKLTEQQHQDLLRYVLAAR